MSDESNNQRAGMSRRDALKRGAAVGGALWVAPVVTAAPAYAEGSPGNLPDCVLSIVKYADPDNPELDWANLTGGPGDWDTRANKNFDLACLGDYAPGGSTPARGYDDKPWGNSGKGTVFSFDGDTYVEKWTAIDSGLGDGDPGTVVNFTVTITRDPATVTIVVSGATVVDAISKQSTGCANDVAVDGNSIKWNGTLDEVSHLTFVICVPVPSTATQ